MSYDIKTTKRELIDRLEALRRSFDRADAERDDAFRRALAKWYPLFTESVKRSTQHLLELSPVEAAREHMNGIQIYAKGSDGLGVGTPVRCELRYRDVLENALREAELLPETGVHELTYWKNKWIYMALTEYVLRQDPKDPYDESGYLRD